MISCQKLLLYTELVTSKTLFPQWNNFQEFQEFCHSLAQSSKVCFHRSVLCNLFSRHVKTSDLTHTPYSAHIVILSNLMMVLGLEIVCCMIVETIACDTVFLTSIYIQVTCTVVPVCNSHPT